MNIAKSTQAYESWLRAELGEEVVEADLATKHDRMREGPFLFLRATYWRWAEKIQDICPELAGAPTVLAVGDIHVENFGTWRDYEGRLVWGVNDFDEAAEMPYVIDIVRLTTSAFLADLGHTSLNEICNRILAGYRKGLKRPRPIVLDHKTTWLHAELEVTKQARKKFWKNFDPEQNRASVVEASGRKALKPPVSFERALDAARPDPSVELTFWPRTAGGGSLGRPRWVGFGVWRHGPIVREAKAMVPSAWFRAHGRGSRRLRCEEAATGQFRCPDPWYAMHDSILVRRLSPNNRKLEFTQREDAASIMTSRMLQLMGRDLAAVHLGAARGSETIAADLAKRGGSKWLRGAVATAAEFVSREQAEWVAAGATRASKA